MELDKAYQLVSSRVEAWIRGFIVSLPNLIVAVLVLILFWLLARLIGNTTQRVLSRFSRSAAVNKLLATLSYLLVLTAGIFIALGILDLDKTVTSLLAGAGIVGLALAFAFRDAAENLIAGIFISIRHPFRSGDLIKTNDYLGVVQHISLRNTHLITPEGQRVLIPNRLVFEHALTNFTATGHRRVDFTVGVSYGDDLRRAKESVMQAVAQIDGREQDREPEVFFSEFADSSINMTVRVWIQGTSQREYLAARSDAIIGVKSAFDREGITIPFPIRTLDFSEVGGVTVGKVIPQGLRVGISDFDEGRKSYTANSQEPSDPASASGHTSNDK